MVGLISAIIIILGVVLITRLFGAWMLRINEINTRCSVRLE